VEHSRCNPFSVKAPASARNPGKICLVEDDRTGSDKFLKNGSTILAIGGSRPCHCFNIPAGRYFHPFFKDRLDWSKREMSSVGCSRTLQVSTPNKAMTSSGALRDGPSAGLDALGTLSIQGKDGDSASKLKNSRTKARMVVVALMPLMAENLAASLSTNQITLR